MLKLRLVPIGLKNLEPAAFRRLCVETPPGLFGLPGLCQPPLGGCVLKRCPDLSRFYLCFQPPLGGCVLKLTDEQIKEQPFQDQPPLGGCVLKL